MGTINQNILQAKYAVRGAIVLRAGEHEKALQRGEKRPFQEIVYCNIGNPQQLGQKPITFFRQVLALVEYPDLLQDSSAANIFPADARDRARRYLQEVRSVGAYSHSQGVEMVRREVAQFIERRDGHPADPEHIFLTDGASPGVQTVLRALLRDRNDGIMIPIPQYPLYSACIPLYGGSQVEYYLDESSGWSLSVAELERSLAQSKARGVKPRALVVINPGNPTGQCLDEANMRDIVTFCADNSLVLMADEVYQENVYVRNKPFVSFKRVLCDLKKADPNRFQSLELVSFHSTSKGMIGECGKRGGYFECFNVSSDVLAELYKLASISLCPNVLGQITVGLMVNPPKKGDPSHAQYEKEIGAIYESLRRRAEKVAATLNSLEGVSCNPSEGAMYCFPTITIPKKAVEEAKKQNVAPDLYYCLQLLDNTGICVVPGSGFGQREGTWHLRTTFLPLEDKLEPVLEKMKVFHAEFMKNTKN